MLPSLSSEHPFGLITMSFPLAIFLEGVLDRGLLIHQVLAMHVVDSIVGCFKVGKGDESIALG